MVKVAYLDIPDALKPLWNDSLRLNSPLVYGSLSVQRGYLSRYKRGLVTTKSLLPAIREIWLSLSDVDRLAWKSAGTVARYSGWALFVQDTAFRMKFGYPGIAIPSEIYQYKVGKILIEAPATRAQIAQFHPVEYYKRKKVPGTKALYTDLQIIERLALPLEIGLSYKAELTSQGVGSYAKFYAKILSHYQGRDIFTEAGFDIPLASEWTRTLHTSTEVLGVARSYSLWIDLFNVRGSLYFDNVRAFHTGTNYARDFRCNDINNTLTTVNYQIERSWEEQILPDGAGFDSVYYD